MTCQSDSREALTRAFLNEAGWGDAVHVPLNQDASTRRYERLTKPSGETAMLMDAPPVEADPCPPGADDQTRNAMGWNAQTRLAASRVDAFVAMATYLTSRGLSAPEIYAQDCAEGLAIIEDFGEGLEFAHLIESGREDEVTLYKAAAETLAFLHMHPAPEAVSGCGQNWPILDFDRLALKTNADLFAEWLPQFDDRMSLSDRDMVRWEEARDTLIDKALSFERDLTLRDFHAENLLWLPDRKGLARVGLLDFQDAVNGWSAWDMAMLLQDARRTVSAETYEAAIRHYLNLTGKFRVAFDEQLATIGTLNALRITGLFARLIKRDGKQRYLEFMPRQQALLARNLGANRTTRDMAGFVRDVAPFIFEAET